jgi:23S rRNA pseudouridine1911/1915/1917 synthase
MAAVDLSKLSGKLALTHLHLLDQNEHGALVRCILETGRTHQIRVHMASLKMPLVGDVLYGGTSYPLMPRQALHAEILAFEHPITLKPLTFKSNLPPDFHGLLEAWSLSYNEKT